MKSRLLIGVMLLVAVFGLFSFWPGLIGAHYDGAVSCPLLSMGDSFGCQNMTRRINNDLFTHISDFASMISAVFLGGFLSLFVFYAVKLFSKIHRAKISGLYFENKVKRLIRWLGHLSLFMQVVFLIFTGLRKGIINTKVF